MGIKIYRTISIGIPFLNPIPEPIPSLNKCPLKVFNHLMNHLVFLTIVKEVWDISDTSSMKGTFHSLKVGK